MKKLTYLLSVCFLIFSCEKDESIIEEDFSSIDTEEISKDEIAKIASLNFNTSDLEMVDYPNSEGGLEKMFLIEGDILMSRSRLEELSNEKLTKQYRTYNLVDNNVKIYIIPRNAPDFLGGTDRVALTSKQRSALTRAVANLNALDIGLTFEIYDGPGLISGRQIKVSQRPGAAGGIAGFPDSNGNPFRNVDIFSGSESYSLNVNEHILTHEICHAIGLRHTDWNTRQSCGYNNGESANPEGAVHIPGTPTGYDSSSLMKACFGSSESGNFGYYDKVAIEYLYPSN
ncbi:M57 family metalloprotease [Zunongwangia pacifica]|uniref:Zinc-dependent metalloprotease n=1 Tax=Zunongwangia pacifica TaxID=2911062 RepID=A0A9X1ZVI7_9FLAO|nr:M57 family metalloprotease [Zunongwangia pacifica]MCL6217151.1 zinc-dependent metalloprotease [Zunongwangia pacifica]